MKACCVYILLLFSVSVKLYILLVVVFPHHLNVAVCIFSMYNQYSLNLFSIHGLGPLNMLL